MRSASVVVAVVLASAIALARGEDDTAAPAAESARSAPTSVEAARARAELLHEAMHATLQVVHHEYFREDEGVTIPAATMKKVFRELANRQGVELRWLAVDAQAMNVDHVAQDSFETAAVEALTAGKDSYEQVEKGVFRRAGQVTLTSDCLKCHLPSRTSTKPRTAALVIKMPVAGK